MYTWSCNGNNVTRIFVSYSFIMNRSEEVMFTMVLILITYTYVFCSNAAESTCTPCSLAHFLSRWSHSTSKHYTRGWWTKTWTLCLLQSPQVQINLKFDDALKSAHLLYHYNLHWFLYQTKLLSQLCKQCASETEVVNSVYYSTEEVYSK